MEQDVEVIYIDDKDDDNKQEDYDCCIVYTRSSQKNGTSISNAISVDQYIRSDKLFIDLTQASHYTDDELQVLHFNPKRQSTFEKGESSNSKDKPLVVCEFCVEPKSQNEFFKVKGCSYAYCNDCMAKYVASKLQENITCIKCPVLECSGKLEPEYCRPLLPSDVFERWGTALCEAVILGSEKFYCPYKDCSAMLVNDGNEVVKESECPFCYRLFCAQCKVPWHTGIGCEEFQKLGENEREKEDIMLKNLAASQEWSRCPKCKFYVQKVSGCLFIKCRCGCEFCYKCGSQAVKSHICPKCHKQYL